MIYFVQAGLNGPIKIGSSKKPLNRLSVMNVVWYEELYLRGLMPGWTHAEYDIHERFAKDRIRGEWFHPSDHLLQFIASLPDHPRMREWRQSPEKRRVCKRPAWSVDEIDRLSAGNERCRQVLWEVHEDILLLLDGTWDERQPPHRFKAQRMRLMRRFAVQACKRWRYVIKRADEKPFRDKLRERQMHLVKLREWRRTGEEPADVPGSKYTMVDDGQPEPTNNLMETEPC